MQPYVRLQEQRQTSRRTIADALEVVRQEFGLDDIGPAYVRISPLRLASGQCTALVDVVFSDLGCGVSLPTSSRFMARGGTSSRPEKFEISRLDRAEIWPDGSVLLADGTRLRAVEVVPTHLPYEPSKLDQENPRVCDFIDQSRLLPPEHSRRSARALAADGSRYPRARFQPRSHDQGATAQSD